MNYRLKYLTLITVSLILSLVIPSYRHNNFSYLSISAQKPTNVAPKTEVDKLFQQAIKQYRRGKYPQALKTYEQVLEIRRQLKDKAGIAQTLNNMGELYYWSQKNDKALEVLQQALAIRKELKDKAGEGEALDNLGLAYYGKQQYEKALEFFQQALVIRKELKDRIGEGKTLSNIGNVYNSGFNKYSQALENLQQALAIQKEVGDKFQIGIILLRIGVVYSNKKDYSRALEWYKKALVANREIGNHAVEGRTLLLIGELYSNQEKYKQAIEFYQQALPMIREAQMQLLEVVNIGAIGYAYLSQKQYDNSIVFYQQALLVARKINNRELEHIYLRMIGNAYYYQGKNEKAIKILQQALTITREINDKLQEANNLFIMAGAYDNQERSIELYQQALAIQREIDNKPAQINSLNALILQYDLKARNLANKGLYAQAKVEYNRIIELGQETLTLASELKNRKIEASALTVLGTAYIFFKDYEKAITLLEKVLSIANEIKDLQVESTALSILASIYNNQGKFRKNIDIRIRQVEIAEQQHDKYNQANSLIVLGSHYHVLGENQKAVDTYHQGLAILRTIEIEKIHPTLQDSVLQFELYGLQGLSRSYKELGEYNKAIDFAQQSVKKAQNLRKPELEADNLLYLAFLYRNGFNNFPKAIKATEQVLSIARQIKTHKLEVKALEELSEIYTKQGNHTQALELASQILKIGKDLQNPKIEGDALKLFVVIYKQQGDYQKALELAQKNLAILRQTRNLPGEIFTLVNLSEIYTSLGNTTKAVENAKQALSIARQTKSFQIEQLALANLADVYIKQGEHEKAIKLLQNVLNIARNTKNFTGEVLATNLMSKAYTALGEFNKVITVAEPAITLAQKINNREKEGYLLINLGNAYTNIGDYTKGKNLVKQGLKIAKTIKSSALESYGLDKLGSIYQSQKNYQKALELTQQSLKISEDIKSPPLMLHSLINIGIIYTELGEYQKSREYYQKALATTIQLKNRRGEGIILLSLATTHFAEGEAQKTVEFAQKALVISREIKVPVLEKLSNLILSIGYGELGQDRQAMENVKSYLEFARKVENPIWEKSALTIIGSIHFQFGRKQQAITAYQQALAIQIDEQIAGANAGIYGGLGQIYRDLNQPNIAITYYKKAVNGIEIIRRSIEGLPPELQASFLGGKFSFKGVKRSDIYRQLAELLISQKRNKEALYVQELLREQEIRDFISDEIGTENKPRVPLNPTEQKVPIVSQSLVVLGKKISECKQSSKISQKCSQLIDTQTALILQYQEQMQKFDREIRENRQNDNVFFDPQNLGQIRKIIAAQPNTLMIYPLVRDKELSIQIYAQGDVIKTIPVKVEREELAKAVAEFRNLMEECEVRVCGTADIPQVQAASQKLYNWLIKPIDKELQGQSVKNLVFALDRVTRYIPMGALYDGKQYLIEKYTVNIMPSAESINVHEKLPLGKKENRVLAMGLSEPRGKFGSLPNVTEELDVIVLRNNKQDKQGIYLGDEYLNNAFDFRTLRDNLKRHNILHLATHGIFDPKTANNSYILLGNGKKLTPNLISTLTDLSNIHLVVLSACQTALGSPKTQNGVEINAFAYRFLKNAAKSVVASLWQVSDRSTSELMQQFYKNLANSKTPMSKAEALRFAQLTLLYNKEVKAKDIKRGGLNVDSKEGGESKTPSTSSNYAHPYYWAPFILIGNGS